MIRKTGLVDGLEVKEEGFWPEIPWKTMTFSAQAEGSWLRR